jgi:hypothetical protein
MLQMGAANLIHPPGPAPANTKSVGAPGAARMPKGRRFTNIFDLLLAIGKNGTGTLVGSVPGMNGQDQIGKAQLPAHLVALSALSNDIQTPETLIGKMPAGANSIDASVVPRRANVATILQGRGAIVNQRLAELVSGQITPVDLEPGNYEVLNSGLQEGTLILEVQSSDKRLIRVSIAASLLTKGTGGNTPGSISKAVKAGSLPERVLLNVSGDREHSKLNELFSKLDIRELHISEIEPNLKGGMKGNPARATVDVKLIAVQGGQEVLLRSKLHKGDIRAEMPGEPRPRRRGSRRGLPVKTAGALSGPKAVDPKAAGITSQVLNAGRSMMMPLSDLESTLFKNLNTGRTPESAMYDPLNLDQAAETLSKPDQVTSGRTSLSAPRFTLPENLANQLKPNGKSVAIRIEPENLGPARLRINMHNGTLTARLTVESVEAKAAVESSLDQLTNQLEKAGIKVNHVEVSVSGGDIHDQWLESRTTWSAPSRKGHNRVLQKLAAGSVDHVETVPYQAPTYIRADQVNIFA